MILPALRRGVSGDRHVTVSASLVSPLRFDWVNAPHRVLRNRTFAIWEAAGCPPPGKRPGEGDVLTTNAVTGRTKVRYSASWPSRDDRGAVTELALYAGQGVDAIRDIPSAGELVERLWKECLAG